MSAKEGRIEENLMLDAHAKKHRSNIGTGYWRYFPKERSRFPSYIHHGRRLNEIVPKSRCLYSVRPVSSLLLLALKPRVDFLSGAALLRDWLLLSHYRCSSL